MLQYPLGTIAHVPESLQLWLCTPEGCMALTGGFRSVMIATPSSPISIVAWGGGITKYTLSLQLQARARDRVWGWSLYRCDGANTTNVVFGFSILRWVERLVMLQVPIKWRGDSSQLHNDRTTRSKQRPVLSSIYLHNTKVFEIVTIFHIFSLSVFNLRTFLACVFPQVCTVGWFFTMLSEYYWWSQRRVWYTCVVECCPALSGTLLDGATAPLWARIPVLCVGVTMPVVQVLKLHLSQPWERA